MNIWMGDNGSCTRKVLENWDRGKSISTYLQVGRIKGMNGFSMLYYVAGTIKQFHLLATICSMSLIYNVLPQSIPGTKV